EALLEKGAAAGAWQVGPPRMIAVMLFDALHGAVDDNLAAKRPMSRARLIEVATAFYRSALAIGRD
ncbi:hypothetical protein ABTH20_20515, partial [Acinetobacter baumannii]